MSGATNHSCMSPPSCRPSRRPRPRRETSTPSPNAPSPCPLDRTAARPPSTACQSLQICPALRSSLPIAPSQALVSNGERPGPARSSPGRRRPASLSQRLAWPARPSSHAHPAGLCRLAVCPAVVDSREPSVPTLAVQTRHRLHPGPCTSPRRRPRLPPSPRWQCARPAESPIAAPRAVASQLDVPSRPSHPSPQVGPQAPNQRRPPRLGRSRVALAQSAGILTRGRPGCLVKRFCPFSSPFAHAESTCPISRSRLYFGPISLSSGRHISPKPPPFLPFFFRPGRPQASQSASSAHEHRPPGQALDQSTAQAQDVSPSKALHIRPDNVHFLSKAHRSVSPHEFEC